MSNVKMEAVKTKLNSLLGEMNELLEILEDEEISFSESFVSQFRNADSLEDFIYQLTASVEDEEALKTKK